ncbi:hypothetical protein [Kitasatospora sp. NPDC056731]|uniref:ATP-binding protein n=1 Tax=Kitasatospora sp. NPDC056731 TaxID=3155422 RepID=UPI00343D5ECD
MPEALDRALADQLCTLPRHPSSPTAARVVLRGFLSDLKDGEHYAGDGELIVTELVASAVRTPPAHHLIDVLFEYSAPAGLWIEVTAIGQSDRAGPDCPGLRLVRRLCAAWGCDPAEGRSWARLAPPVAQ